MLNIRYCFYRQLVGTKKRDCKLWDIVCLGVLHFHESFFYNGSTYSIVGCQADLVHFLRLMLTASVRARGTDFSNINMG